MKASIALVILNASVFRAAGAAFVTFSANNPTIERETVVVAWAPANNFDVTTWIELEKAPGAWEVIGRKVTFARNGDTDFVVPSPGTYRFRYIDRSLTGEFQRELAVSPLLVVSDIIPNPALVKNLGRRGERVVFVGDSLVQGTGVLPEESVPAQVGSIIGVPVVNAGKHGDTTAQILARLGTDVLAHQPDLVVVLAGWNDYRIGVPSDTTFRNLREVVRRVQSQGAMAVIVGLKKPLFDDFERQFRAASEETGAGYIPNILYNLEDQLDFWNISEKHPSSKGYREVAERIAPAPRKLLALPPKLYIQKSTNSVTLSWHTLWGKTYHLRELDTAVSSTWTETLFLGTGRTVEVQKPLSPQRFFTVVEK
jgi:acyl-CoA thioesterase-1